MWAINCVLKTNVCSSNIIYLECFSEHKMLFVGESKDECEQKL